MSRPTTPKAAARMQWADLLFLHWRVPPDAIRAALPEGLELDTFDGSAWIGLVPFRMARCSFTGFGWMPRLENFYECNVRTYVRARALCGVWFFSLDAQNLLPVLGGRWMWNLNYVYSAFDVRRDGHTHNYALKRRPGPWPKAETRISWEVTSQRTLAKEGSLEHFLTERYWLFTSRRNSIYAGRVRHNPWPLHNAELRHVHDSLIGAAGIAGCEQEPESVLASPMLEVSGDALMPLDAAANVSA